MDSIEIRGLRLRGRFGVAAAERAAELEVVVDIAVQLPLQRAAQTDDVADTLDYAALCAAAQRLAAARPWRLLESYAGALLDLIFTDARRALICSAVWVTLTSSASWGSPARSRAWAGTPLTTGRCPIL